MSLTRRRSLSRRLSETLPPYVTGGEEEEVEHISLLRSPGRTLRLFCSVVAGQAGVAWWWLRARALLPISVYVCARLAAGRLDAGAHGYFVQLEHLAWFAAWWLGLGVLSSIGLGSGLHSGILFLFPHIAKVCRSAEACGHLHFDTTRNIWFVMGTAELFPCAPGGVPGQLSLAHLMAKTLVANIIWGVGTALGEVPPYLVARAAAMRGAGKRKSQRVAAQTHDIKVAEFVAEQTGTEDGGVFYKIQTWMVYVLQSHGFWALVLLASIPNPAFDLCGMCCGTFQMALPTFLGGVLVGKGIVKPLWQCALFTIIFHVQTRAAFADRVGGALQLVLPQSAQAKRRLHDALAALSAPSRGPKPTGVLAKVWSASLVAVVLYFSITCIEQIAQEHALQEAAPNRGTPKPAARGTPKGTPKGTPRSARRLSGHVE